MVKIQQLSRWLFLIVLGGCTVVPAAPLPQVTVYKDPLCGCCAKWITHMKKDGWPMNVIAFREHFNVPQSLQSCHTSTIDNYVFEGHIPSDYIERFLREKPNVRGLAVPAMPLNSPGMESRASRDAQYVIYSFTDDGEIKEYAYVTRVEQ